MGTLLSEDELEVRVARSAELPDCLGVRREVFILGQGVPEELEVDGRDAACTHFVARRGAEVLGTARLRESQEGPKAERVAVLSAHRGEGLGHRLMDVLEGEARERGASGVFLHAQSSVVAFYESRGYKQVGPDFEEAGIPHRPMRKTF